MIFAAGLGTRLRPLTSHRPKALVDVAGRPMLDRVMERLAAAGVDTVVVNVHHFAPMVVDYINSHPCHGLRVLVSDESGRLLDTGGGINKAAHFLDGDEPFIVHNADILSDVDLRAMLDTHTSSGADATLLVADRTSSRYLLFDTDNRLAGWTNTKTGEVKPRGLDPAGYSALAFGGIHIISPSVLKPLAAYSVDPCFSIIPFYVDSVASLNIRAFNPDPSTYRWHDIGSVEKLRAAESDTPLLT